MAEAAIIGGLASIAGQGIQLAAKAKEARRQAEIGAENKALYYEEALLTEQRAREQERQYRVAGEKAIGAQRASIGASGIALEGSSQDALEESAANIELDALTIRHNGFAQARKQRRQGDLAEKAGSAALGALPAEAASTVLMAGSKVATFV